jgi:hypothetical protein
VPERDDTLRMAAVAGRGLGLVILTVLTWKVLADPTAGVGERSG